MHILEPIRLPPELHGDLDRLVPPFRQLPSDKLKSVLLVNGSLSLEIHQCQLVALCNNHVHLAEPVVSTIYERPFLQRATYLNHLDEGSQLPIGKKKYPIGDFTPAPSSALWKTTFKFIDPCSLGFSDAGSPSIMHSTLSAPDILKQTVKRTNGSSEECYRRYHRAWGRELNPPFAHSHLYKKSESVFGREKKSRFFSRR